MPRRCKIGSEDKPAENCVTILIYNVLRPHSKMKFVVHARVEEEIETCR